jgi:hypothetical protein
MASTLKWYSALLAFETGIEPEEGEEAVEQYSLSAILFQAADRQAWATAEALGGSDDDDLPFVTGWRFVGVLTVHDVAPDEEIRQGSEVYSTFISSAVLEDLRAAFALPSNPVEDATGRRYPE